MGSPPGTRVRIVTGGVHDPRKLRYCYRTVISGPTFIKIPPTGIPLEDIERLALIEALKMSNWVQKDAAELLGISAHVMNYKIKILGIEFPRSRRTLMQAESAAHAVV